MTNEPEQLISGAEVSRRLNVSEPKVQRLIKGDVLRPDFVFDKYHLFKLTRLPELELTVLTRR